jgi:hypothetical protein
MPVRQEDPAMMLIERAFAAVTVALCNLFQMTQEDVERVKARELGRRGDPFHPGTQDWEATGPTETTATRQPRQVVVRFGR